MKDRVYRLLPIPELRAHEETLAERVEKVKGEILGSGVVSTPLWVDERHRIVLNGHHRLAALKELGCGYAPVLLVDYGSASVTVGVCPGASIPSINKEAVTRAALSGRLFPPRSSLHALDFIPRDVSTPLSALQRASLGTLKP